MLKRKLQAVWFAVFHDRWQVIKRIRILPPVSGSMRKTCFISVNNGNPHFYIIYGSKLGPGEDGLQLFYGTEGAN